MVLSTSLTFLSNFPKRRAPSCGRPLLLQVASGTHTVHGYTLAGLSSDSRSTWPVNLSLRVFNISHKSIIPALLINSSMLVIPAVLPCQSQNLSYAASANYIQCTSYASRGPIFNIHAVRTADTENNHTADSQIRFLFTFLSLINDADSAGTILLKMYRHEYRNFAHVF